MPRVSFELQRTMSQHRPLLLEDGQPEPAHPCHKREVAPSKQFKELLERLASEHEKEVRQLRDEVARLQDKGFESEVVQLRAEVERLQRYHVDLRTQHGQHHAEAGTCLPLCNTCRDGKVPENLHEEKVLIFDAAPALTEGGWASDTWMSSTGQQSRWNKSMSPNAVNGATATDGMPSSESASTRGPRGRLTCGGGGGTPWGCTGDVGGSPEWKDPTRKAVDAEEIFDTAGSSEDPVRKAVDVESFHTEGSSEGNGSRRKSVDVASLASDPIFHGAEHATGLELWKMFIAYGQGQAQVKGVWLDAVSNWKSSQQQAAAANPLRLTNMISLLAPRGGEETDSADALGTRQGGASRVRRRCTECLEVLVTHPNAPRRILWDMFGIMLLMHDLVMLPMSVFNLGTEGLGTSYEQFQEAFDLTSSVFWSTDMIVSFLTGYLTTEGLIEVRPHWVARNYIKTWFSLDLFIVAVDWVSFFFNGLDTNTSVLRLGKTVSRFMRVLRLLRFMKLNTTLRDLLAMINSEYVLTLVSLMKILLGMVIMNHYLACLWYYLSISLQQGGTFHTWTAEALGTEPGVRLGYAYTTSLHWSLTQFTPASMEVFPENEIERFFNIVVIIFALVIFSSFVSGITQAMTHIRNINSARMAREGEIRIFLSSNKISHKLASRIWRSVRQNNTQSLGQRRVKLQDVQLLRMLPDPIKEELREEIYVPRLTQHPLFREYFNYDPDVIGQFCTNAVTEATLRSGEHALVDWKAVKEFVFVLEGSLEYHCPAFEEPIEVDKDGWVCELALWATQASLDGPLLAGRGGAEVLKISGDQVQKIAVLHAASSDVLGRYAKLFIRNFNTALFDDTVMPLFNDKNDQEMMMIEVMKQCGKARGTWAYCPPPLNSSTPRSKLTDDVEAQGVQEKRRLSQVSGRNSAKARHTR
mmetsp:Transcript_51504/g.159789  ORF Transcript_51504/g.159789 Transcript_51504/m.159789 type:complete len:923 (-) Transcript_51504:195-2963(-)